MMGEGWIALIMSHAFPVTMRTFCRASLDIHVQPVLCSNTKISYPETWGAYVTTSHSHNGNFDGQLRKKPGANRGLKFDQLILHIHFFQNVCTRQKNCHLLRAVQTVAQPARKFKPAMRIF